MRFEIGREHAESDLAFGVFSAGLTQASEQRHHNFMACTVVFNGCVMTGQNFIGQPFGDT